jgi:hypothetical protein
MIPRRQVAGEPRRFGWHGKFCRQIAVNIVVLEPDGNQQGSGSGQSQIADAEFKSSKLNKCQNPVIVIPAKAGIPSKAMAHFQLASDSLMF